MPFEAGRPAQARKDPLPCLHGAHDQGRLLLGLKLPWKKFGRRTTSKARPSVTHRPRLEVERKAQTAQRCRETCSTSEGKEHIPARQRKDLQKQKGRLPPEGNRQERKLPFENGIFLEANISSKRNTVSRWGHLRVERSIGKRGS